MLGKLVQGKINNLTLSDIRNYRLINQFVAQPAAIKPAELISRMGAIQAQEFVMVRWALGLRIKGINDADVMSDFNSGKIIRTHILRPTWHWVAPRDLKWMLKLSAPRVQAFNAFMYRKMRLDTKKLNKCADIIMKLLEGKQYKTRTDIKNELAKHKLKGDTVWLSCAVMYAELEALICSGPRVGKQFTYALLDERITKHDTYDEDDALAELTKRYFTMRGPATVHDYAWWSGLTITQCKKGIAMLGSKFKQTEIDGKNYIYPKTVAPKDMDKLQTTYLMPDYDEYGISYKDRSALKDDRIDQKTMKDNSNMWSHWLILNGMIAGTWERIEEKDKVTAKVHPLVKLSKKDEAQVNQAVKKYEKFFNS